MESSKDNRPEVDQPLLQEFIKLTKVFATDEMSSDGLAMFFNGDEGSTTHAWVDANYSHVEGLKEVCFRYTTATIDASPGGKSYKHDSYTIDIEHYDRQEGFESGYLLLPHEGLEVVDENSGLHYSYSDYPHIFDVEGNKLAIHSTLSKHMNKFDDKIAVATEHGDQAEVLRLKEEKYSAWIELMHINDFVAEQSSSSVPKKFINAFELVKGILPKLRKI